MFGVEFYPTPANLIEKIVEDFNISFSKYKSILEPSAGKGDICDRIKHFKRYDYSVEIDCIEIDNDLRNVLKGKEYRVIYDDFLTFHTFKHYDLIFMNPPFSDGDEHLMKAISLVKDGGDIICILNAETIKNPCNNRRKALLKQLDKYNAEIKYYENAFTDAENKTNVEIAVIYISVPVSNEQSVFLKYMQKKYYAEYKAKERTGVAFTDSIRNAILQYNIDIEAGIKLIKEYYALQETLKNSFTSEYHNPIMELKISEHGDAKINDYVKAVRYKYWDALFKNPDFTKQMTSNLLTQYTSKINELRDYDFNEYNIREIKIDITKNLVKGVEDCIIKLFDELSHQYAWYDTSDNIHYYNGWKTNKAWIINKKVVMPYDAFREVYNYEGYRKVKKPSKLDFGYTFTQKLSDIEKVLNYLDDGSAISINLYNTLEWNKRIDNTKKIVLKHFTITVYKKGTCHIEFHSDALLKKFNIFGSQHKGWLPQSYGRKTYNEMTEEEKSVIDEFEGKESYQETLNRRDYYLAGAEQMLMLVDSKEG